MNSMRIRYFALVGDERTTDNPYNVFREVIDKNRYVLERLDANDPNNWVLDKELGSFLFKGEPGAEEITEDQARKFVESRGGHFSPPELQP